MSEFSLLPWQGLVSSGQNGDIFVSVIRLGLQTENPSRTSRCLVLMKRALFLTQRKFLHMEKKAELSGVLGAVRQTFLRRETLLDPKQKHEPRAA